MGCPVLLCMYLPCAPCSYFAQILEEHGPLSAEDPLLVGELQHFPGEAQLKIQEAGGFEPFLLESLRFVKIGGCVGLAQHAVSLQQAEHGASLDDLDVIVDPDGIASPSDIYAPSFMTYPDNYITAPPEVHPILPSPYVYGSHTMPPLYNCPTSIENGPPYQWACDDRQVEASLLSDNEELDLYCGTDDTVLENDPSSGRVASVTTKESFLKKDAAAQVNTNISLPF